MRNETWAIILAAGQGKRFGQPQGAPAKQFITLGGAPLFWSSAAALARTPRLDGIVFVFPPALLQEASAMARACAATAPLGIPYLCAAGGAERQDSVRLGLAALPPACTKVLVHDAARPFVSPQLAARLMDALDSGHPAVIPGLEPADTIKVVSPDGLVQNTPPRSSLRMVQTPQAFNRDVLEEAHRQGLQSGLPVTDDAMLAEAAGFPVLLVPGEAANIKITRAEDLAMLQNASSKNNLLPCTGLGYDVHKYGGNRPLRLGGILVENGGFTVQAHSDGDVLLHALADALLGCAAAGDIGEHFPDSDPAFEGASSSVLLSEVLELVRGRGIVLTHVDLTVIAQAPKLSPYKTEITKNIAKLLHLDEQQVNLKATTEEGLGFTGAKEGVKALALVTALRPA